MWSGNLFAENTADKINECSKKTSTAKTEFSAQIIYSACFNDNKKMLKCGLETENAQTRFAAEIIYSSCYKEN